MSSQILREAAALMRERAEAALKQAGAEWQTATVHPETAAESRVLGTHSVVHDGQTLGYDGIGVFNLYAFRATKPSDLWKAEEPTGGERNNDILREVLRQGKAHPVIAAWGVNAKPDRVAEFMSWRGSERVLSLGVTKAGAPRHPLYVRGDAPLIPWQASA